MQLENLYPVVNSITDVDTTIRANSYSTRMIKLATLLALTTKEMHAGAIAHDDYQYQPL